MRIDAIYVFFRGFTRSFKPSGMGGTKTINICLAMNEPTKQNKFTEEEPFNQGFLSPQEGHSIFYEEYGSPSGLPVVFLHGGPGSGCSPRHRQLFNPRTTRVVFFDQRGCGRSLADNPLHANTTEHLISDIERLRKFLKIDRWLVVGGSWGATLGLAYANTHRQACLGAVLRGIFLARSSDLTWFFQDAQCLLPDAWHSLSQHIPAQCRSQIGSYLFEQILHDVGTATLPMVHAWQNWENSLTQRCDKTATTEMSAHEKQILINKYKVQSHYLVNQCFFPSDGLLSQISALKDLPIHLLHGRLDWICLPQAAWALHQVLPQSRLQWIDDAGHNPFEPPLFQAMFTAIEEAVTAFNQLT
jgi:proline iminopeptidase